MARLYEILTLLLTCVVGLNAIMCHNDYAQVRNGHYTAVNSNKTIIIAKCNAGYEVSGEAQRKCLATEGWTEPAPTCQDIDECQTGQMCHRNANCTNTIGTFTCTCHHGRFVGSGRKQRKGCRKLRCPRTWENITNADIKWSRDGHMIFVKCHDLYSIRGEARNTCTYRRVWSRAMPFCQKIPLCRPPVPMDNGRQIFGGNGPFKYRSTVTMMCNEGYSMVGPSKWVCRRITRWEGQQETKCTVMGLTQIGNKLQKTLKEMNDNMNQPPRNPDARFNPNDKRGVDIGFLIDTSASVSLHNFKKGMELIKMIVRELHLKSTPNNEQRATGTKRVLVITFSDTATTHFKFNQSVNWTEQETMNNLDKIVPISGRSNLKAGLAAMSEAYAFRPAEVVSVLFVLTDGQILEPDAQFKLSLTGLKTNSKVEVYTIGIGQYVNNRILDMISTRPLSTHKFLLNKYDDIEVLKKYVIDRREDCDRCGKTIHNDNMAASGLSKPDLWPWNVFIRIQNGTSNFYCGGVLLQKMWVLSSAQCFKWRKRRDMTIQSNQVSVTLGKDGSDKKTEIRVRSINLHPEYMPRYPYFNDLALLNLVDDDIKFSNSIRKICFYTKNSATYFHPYVRQSLYTAGWGITNARRRGVESFERHIHHQKTNDFVIPAECKPMLDSVAYPKQQANLGCIEKTNIDRGKTDVCRGDVGGPIVWRDSAKNKKATSLVGVVTYNTDCNLEGKFTVVTKLEAYADWIVNMTSTNPN